ncbi:hypothetical protein [Methanobrevibacter millerae]|uniref:Uncharacterized protein n=1 Tax=Methanobrevibacter millerae TaxID=230361 RepID=A0A1G5VXC6_9EURY|nr:hypothetical protein [Methanobrevibacter millerae]SDA50509.1 hypothetical protein SAMN02910315_00979 [Methanobrevibacter millerae]
MDLLILKADSSKEMNKISQELSDKKFKKIQEENHFILMKKNRYGNFYVHILFLMIGLFYFYLALIVNVVYFTYSYLWASPHVLITTETKSEDSEDLEFNTMDEVLEKANKLF